MVFGGQVMLTASVSALAPADKAAVLNKVRTFDQFDTSNDPHREHDFGAFEHEGVRYFWKIDYYDLAMRYGSPDPANAGVTSRVLTIMRDGE
jgi:hypothetical protein